MTAFYSLPRRARIEYCRRLAQSALEQWRLSPRRLRLIPAHHPNFHVEDASGRRYLLKFCVPLEPVVEHGLGIEPWYGAHACGIDLQFEWQEALGSQTDLRLQTPIRTPSGKFIQYVSLPGDPNPVAMTLSTWLPGRVLAKSWPWRQPGTQRTRDIGRLTATMHAHAASWQPARGQLAVRPWTPTAQQVFDFAMRYKPAAAAMSATDRKLLGKAMDRVLSVFGRIDADPRCCGIIHADLCPHNLLLCDNQLVPIDFIPITGPYLWDIVLLFDTPQFNTPEFGPLYRAWFEGYREAGELPADYAEITEAIFMFFGISQIYDSVVESTAAPQVVPSIKVPRALWLADRMVNGPPFPPL